MMRLLAIAAVLLVSSTADAASAQAVSGASGEEDEQRFGQLDAGKFDHYMRVNALSALLVTERLLPNLRQGRQKKVALNMILRNIAMDVQQDGIAVAALSPGVVNTCGTPDNHEAMSPEMRRSMSTSTPASRA